MLVEHLHGRLLRATMPLVNAPDVLNWLPLSKVADKVVLPFDRLRLVGESPRSHLRRHGPSWQRIEIATRCL